MYIDKQIKREIAVITITIIVLLILFIGITYAYFLSADNGEDDVISVGDLKISYCTDETCNKNYSNLGQVIGTKIVDGKSVVEGIYPYINDTEALKSTPYIFNIKNTGSLKSYVTIKLVEDNDYINDLNLKKLTDNYSENLKIGISKCDNKIDRDNVLIQKYSELNNSILLTNQTLLKGEDITYCLWTWLDENTPNSAQSTYFVANLDFKVEYKPN